MFLDNGNISAFLNLEMNTEAEQQLLHHARNGNAEEVRQLLETVERNEVIADINCKGKFWMDFFAFSCSAYALYLICPTLSFI